MYLFSIFKINTIKWDKKENDFFSFISLIKGQKGILLDIGANIGVMSVHLSKSKKNCTLVAFEPIPSNIEIFKKIIRFYKLNNVKLLECALGNSEKKVKMVLPQVNQVFFQGLSHVLSEENKLNCKGITYEVQMKKLDSFDFEDKILAIKIDVENYEFEVLKGAKSVLSTHQPMIYCELWENENRVDCFNLMKELKYDIYCFVKKNLIPFDPKVHQTQNFIFIPITKNLES